MKLHHTAGIVLAGWVLLIPPMRGGEGRPKRPEPQAPLSAWTVFRRFDSAAACREWKVKLETNARRAGRYGPLPAFVCIAEDDPRLKGE